MRMQLKMLGLLVVAALVLNRVGVAQQPADKAVADEVIRITRAMWAAGNQRDLAGAMKNIADDYTQFDGDYATRLEGKELSTSLTDAGFRDSGKTLVSEMINPKVQVFGNVAVLTYNYVGVVQSKDGVNQPARAKSTRVYVKRGNDWMLVHANFAPDPLPRN